MALCCGNLHIHLFVMCCDGLVMNCENFSSLHRLLRVTALVLKFVCLLRQNAGTQGDTESTDHMRDISQARLYWIRESQAQLPQHDKFQVWKQQFGLFVDELHVWRCGGRLSNSDLPIPAQNPILLDWRHHLALPDYRVKRSRPFSHTGVDFASPLYTKQSAVSERPKTWLCLYMCCTTRAVHLDLVPDFNASTFLRCFKQLTARRGVPAKVLSDNGKTFKSASKIVRSVFSDPKVQKYFADLNVQWTFNLEKAPWWGGIFERLIQSTKRCLKKVVGKACLTYDELFTIVTEIEAVLNSQLLSYVTTDDLEEPFTLALYPGAGGGGGGEEALPPS